VTPRAVIFDFWGTLVALDWEYWRAGYAKIAGALGVPLDRFQSAWHADYEQRLVSDLRTSIERVCTSLGVTSAEAIDEVVSIRIDTHRQTVVPRPDAVPTLRELRARGYKTGLLSNCSSELPELVAESVLAGLFDAEVFSAIYGLRKPDRAIYELVAKRLGVNAGQCLYIGDGDDHELDGALAAGMRPVLLRTEYPPDGWRGEEITDLSEVLALLG
jgi:putative hydrolase of the HAD superfamily